MKRVLLFVLVALLIVMAAKDLTLYGKQYDFVGTTAHAAALIGGIGSGKSQAGAVRALLASQGVVGNQRIKTPNVGFVVAPTYNVLRDATLRTFRDVAGDYIDVRNSAFAPPIRLQMFNGSEVLFRSADNPESLRGPNISWWWGDEAALFDHNTWRVMIGRIRQHGAYGYSWLTTTPRGRNWIWQTFAKKAGQGQIVGDHVWWNVRTAENPFLSTEFVAALQAAYVGDYAAQELDGAFVAFEGLVYAEFDRDTHMTRDVPKQFARTIAGVDWGYVAPGVILVIGITADDRQYVIHEEYVRQRSIDDWTRIAVQLRDIWNIRDFMCDPSEPDNIKKFRAAGVRAFAADNTMTVGIQAVKRRLGVRADGLPGLILYPGAANLASEFEGWQWARKGETMIDEPMAGGDHALDALRYAVIEADRTRRGNRTATVETYA